ncbi:MAG: RNA polymerase sigma factor, partial [bacterium]|nr:RNA polymerase sigma factor [bacterium]
METHDLALLARWHEDRDAEAFTELVHRHAGMVFSTCRRVLRNVSDAEDVAQECFALLAHGTKAPRKHVGAWLHRVATTRALNHIDSDKRRRAREERFAENTGPVSAAELDDLADHVDEAINALPARLRTPLVAHFFEGQTHEAVGETLGMPRGTVTYRINRGVHLVRRTLRRRGVIVGATAFAAWMQAQAAEAAPRS